ADCPELAFSAEHEMTRTGVTRPSAFEQIARLPGVEDVDGGSGRLLGGEDGEQHGATAGQDLRKLVPLSFLGDCQLARLAARSGSRPEAGAHTADDDLVTWSPRPSAQRVGGNYHLRRAVV